MATCPQPGTAVKAEARSIVSRMKRRLSIARSCSAGGSSSCGLLNVWTTAMPPPKVHPPPPTVKCFTKQSKSGRPGALFYLAPADLLAWPDVRERRRSEERDCGRTRGGSARRGRVRRRGRGGARVQARERAEAAAGGEPRRAGG